MALTANDLQHTITLPYGREQVEVVFPPDYEMTTLAPRAGHALPDPDEAVLYALRHPVGRPPLREWVRPGERIAIVTSDATRPALQSTYLPHVLAELEAAGTARENVLLVIGLGTHRPPTDAEVRALLGAAAGDYRVAWSDCDDESALVSFGTTRRGTPVRIFRTVVEADRVILTGSINHHVMAGFSAGPKSLLPGIAARDSILANHALALNPTPPGGLNPMCNAGVLDGNPIQEDFVEALGLFPVPAFLVNVVPAPEGGLLQAVAGDPVGAHRAGCRTADEYYALPVSERRDFVFASCGGHPSDMVFYQSTKGLINMSAALSDKGVGVLLAECGEGLGADFFLDWLRIGSPEAIEAELRQAFAVPGRVAHYVASTIQRATIILVSTLAPEVVRELGLIPAASAQAAVELVAERLGPSACGYVMSKASVVVPLAAGAPGNVEPSTG